MSLPRAKKSYGQNFLINETVVKKIIDAASLTQKETVLEIGPGTGLLTKALLETGARVVAVEADHDLIAPLRDQFGESLTLLEGDVLGSVLFHEQDTHLLADGSFKLIANIPYYITSQILERFLTTSPKPTELILMVQREVADRILAAPPDMSLLAVVCQVYATCSRVTNVKAGSFRPIPKVDSAVIHLHRKPETELAQYDPEKIIALAKVGFSSKRKQLHHNLAGHFKRTDPSIGSAEVKNALEQCGLNTKIRAEELCVDDWICLEHIFSTEK